MCRGVCRGWNLCKSVLVALVSGRQIGVVFSVFFWAPRSRDPIYCPGRLIGGGGGGNPFSKIIRDLSRVQKFTSSA